MSFGTVHLEQRLKVEGYNIVMIIELYRLFTGFRFYKNVKDRNSFYPEGKVSKCRKFKTHRGALKVQIDRNRKNSRLKAL